MKLVIIYSIITFSYTQYFVHSYTVDVVFTLSYWTLIELLFLNDNEANTIVSFVVVSVNLINCKCFEVSIKLHTGDNHAQWQTFVCEGEHHLLKNKVIQTSSS